MFDVRARAANGRITVVAIEAQRLSCLFSVTMYLIKIGIGCRTCVTGTVDRVPLNGILISGRLGAIDVEAREFGHERVRL